MFGGEGSSRHGWRLLPCFCIRKALAACVYRSAAASYFSVRPPKRLKPPPAPAAALSACGGSQQAEVVEKRGAVDLL